MAENRRKNAAGQKREESGSITRQGHAVHPRTPASQSFLVGALLAMAGGYLDVYTYISRGGVFANAQTGNIVFLGIYMAKRDFDRVLFYSWPILSFALGVIVTELIRWKERYNPKIHWRQIVVVLEFAVLWTIAFVPSGKYDDMVNVAVAFVCSMQVESFRSFHGNAYTTTMCTGNLRSAAEQLFLSCARHDGAAACRSVQYFGVIVFFILGAILGSKITESFGEKSVLVACVLLLAVFVIMFLPPEIKSREENAS